MTTARGQCGAACLSDGRIFALGGSDGLNALRSVECYSDLQGKSAWRAASFMHHRRNKPSVVAVKDSVIVMGGWDKIGHLEGDIPKEHYVDATELLDTRGDGQWTILMIRTELSTTNLSLYACKDGVLAVGKS